MGQRIPDWGRNTQGKYKNGGKPRKDNPWKRKMHQEKAQKEKLETEKSNLFCLQLGIGRGQVVIQHLGINEREMGKCG